MVKEVKAVVNELKNSKKMFIETLKKNNFEVVSVARERNVPYYRGVMAIREDEVIIASFITNESTLSLITLFMNDESLNFSIDSFNNFLEDRVL